uniref:Putative tail protein n=1 Tax=viral metagenome TaxID=1070528 RepID=A0A6M3KX79_9ZZZZ
MAFITARTQLAARIEVNEGTPETVTAEDVRHCLNPAWSTDTPMDDRTLVQADLSPHSLVPGLRSARMEFDMEIKGSGTLGKAPAIGDLLRGCGLDRVAYEIGAMGADTYKIGDMGSDEYEIGAMDESGQQVNYEPESTDMSSLTLAFYMDGLIKKMWGARGDVTFSFNVGKPAMAHFVFTGADFSVTDGSMLSSITYELTNPPAFLSSAFTIQSYAALIGTVEIAMNNSVVLRQDSRQGSGYKNAIITGRSPVLTLDPEAVKVADHDFYGLLRAGTKGALSMVLGATEGNICTITAPQVQYRGISSDDKDGIRAFGIECKLNRSAGNDELSLAFT